MRLSFLPAAALVLSAALPGATVTGTPCVEIIVDSVRQSLCAELGIDGKTFEATFGGGEPVDIFDGENQLIAQIAGLTFGGNIDPTIAYGISVIDFGAPSSFVFLFSMPIVPGSYTHAFSTIGVGVTDAGSNGASAGLLAGELNIQSGTSGALNLGVDVGAACIGPAGVASTCPAESKDNFAVVGGPFTALSLRVAFAGSGGGDAIGLTGRLDLDDRSAVPEPGTLGLTAAALAGLACWRRRARAA